jgi:hypothetical protein
VRDILLSGVMAFILIAVAFAIGFAIVFSYMRRKDPELFGALFKTFQDVDNGKRIPIDHFSDQDHPRGRRPW